MQNSDQSKKLLILVSGTLVLLSFCACIAVCAGIWAYFNYNSVSTSYSEPTFSESRQEIPPASPTPLVIHPTRTPAAVASPTLTPETQPEASLSAPEETLRTLELAVVPINDPLDLARRLEGKEDLPRSLEFQVAEYQVGDQEQFWVTDTDTNENFQINATLRYETDHAYFWIEEGVSYSPDHLANLMETFEQEIYPTNREFFGSEWSPGVDADPHLYILYTTGMGGSVAGYFSTVDEYLPVVREDSNGHEMFLLSADHVDLGDEFAYGVLAHEFQHMIHWFQDRNEETWLNEGFSDLAMFLNGYNIGGADRAYVVNPDIQLTDWPTNSNNRLPHYGASFLFVAYFLDRFGENATQALVADESNGMVSIDRILSTLAIQDPLRGAIVQADDVFADWVLASYLQDDRVADGRYTYHNYPAAPNPTVTEEIRSCPQDMDVRQVNQYGADYIHIDCSGDYTLSFEGSLHVNVMPTDPYSGNYAFYSNKGDESDITLTRSFDFRDHPAGEPLTLTYWTWYDLEEDYDYLYLLASQDGQNWQFLTTPSGTAENPSGNSYGWGYNGFSGNGPGWIQEQVDISQFAGQQVELRFEYITDATVNGDGFLLDDIAVPEIGYFSDFETDAGGWIADGFVRIQNLLPQTFRVSLIRLNGVPSVELIELDSTNSAQIPLRAGEEVILVVSGTARFTRQPAAYQFSILP